MMPHTTPPMRSVRVARKTVEAQDVFAFELVDPTGCALTPFSAGSHILVHLDGGLSRPYSLCGDPADTNRYVIAVLREPASRGGSVSMHALIEGQLITISEPRNHFALCSDSGSHLLLAGGIGVTPLLSMAEQLTHARADFELHCCSRSRERTAFVDRIASSAFATRTHFHYDNGPSEQRLDVATLLKSCESDTHLYVCGPKGFMDHVLGTAREYGWSEARLHWESFSPAVAPAGGNVAFEVQIASTRKVIAVAADQSITQALSAQGIGVPVSCEVGVCGTCITRILDGTPDHRDMYLTPEEQASGDYFTPCCSRAKCGRLLLDL